MVNSRISRHNVIAAFGNYSVYAANQSIWSADGECLVAPGQLVVFDPVKQKSLGAGITVSTNPTIVIGVGHDTNGDGVSDCIRACFGDILYGYNITGASAEAPGCGVGPIKDVFFDCTSSNEDYSFVINVENYRTRTEFAYGHDAKYFIHAKVAKTACDTCDSGIACKLVQCKIVDAASGKALGKDHPLYRDKFTANAIKNQWADAPIQIVNLYGSENLTKLTTKEFCVSTVAGSCDNCVDTNFLFTTATYTDTTLETPATHTITFTNVANTAGTATLQAQLDRVINQINTGLQGRGSAVLRKSTGKCCSYVIEVNTCFDDFAITGLVPCDEYNPFDFTPVQSTTCLDCAEVTAASKIALKCGFRIIGKTTDYDCSVYATTSPIVNFLTKISVSFQNGFKEGQYYVRDIQEGTEPKNLGYTWQYIDYISDNGGSARSHKDTTDYYGRMPLPGKNTRLTSGGVISCPSQYCSYTLTHNLPHRSSDVFGWEKQVQGLTYVIIKSGDTVSRTSWEAIINPYLSSVPFPKLATITCGSDQDQDNGTYPDYNAHRKI